jgi:hypothetical protein
MLRRGVSLAWRSVADRSMRIHWVHEARKDPKQSSAKLNVELWDDVVEAGKPAVA